MKAIVEDVGADREVIVSISGFQAGAIRAASTSNMTLADLKSLRALASEDMQALAVQDVETRVYVLQRALMSFFVLEQIGPNNWKNNRAIKLYLP